MQAEVRFSEAAFVTVAFLALVLLCLRAFRAGSSPARVAVAAYLAALLALYLLGLVLDPGVGVWYLPAFALTLPSCLLLLAPLSLLMDVAARVLPLPLQRCLMWAMLNVDLSLVTLLVLATGNASVLGVLISWLSRRRAGGSGATLFRSH